MANAKVVIRRIVGEDLYYPEFWCDQCGKRIVGQGNYEYPEPAGIKKSVDQVFYTHKRCTFAFRAAQGGQDKFRWEELRKLPKQLAENLKQKPRK